jgi:hypothetical protein
MTITIVNEFNDGQSRSMMGPSNMTYLFSWNPTIERYAYVARNQAEVDDILSLLRFPAFPWRLSVLYEEGSAAAAGKSTPSIAPFIAPSAYFNHTVEELKGLAADCGITLRGDTSIPDVIRAQLDAYCIGRAWAIKEQKLAAEIETPDVATPPVPPMRRKPGPKPGVKYGPRTRVAIPA